MSWVLDTNMFVFCLRGKNPSVRRRLLDARPQAVFVPLQVRTELLVGAAKSAREEANRAAVRELLAPFELILPDTSIAEDYIRIRVALEKMGRTISEADLWIAATAVNCGATLVTNNTDEFSRIAGLSLEDWSQ
jgi:tRNA(fMet)-specific endonuclease VapC